MKCTVCTEPLSKARLLAMPQATMCVSCLNKLGDVLPLRRFDENSGENVVETLFTSDRAIGAQIKRERTHMASSKVLAEGTESDILKPMAPETNADRRGNIFNILNSMEETDGTTEQH